MSEKERLYQVMLRIFKEADKKTRNNNLSL